MEGRERNMNSDERRILLVKISDGNSDWLEKARRRRGNRKGLRRSQLMAIEVLKMMDIKDMTKDELANKMGVTRQRIETIVKGKHEVDSEILSKMPHDLRDEIEREIEQTEGNS